MKFSGKGRSAVIIGRNSSSGRYSTVEAPGIGSVRIISERTFRSAASSASKVLREGRAGKETKWLAASALSQRPDKKRK